MSFKYLTNIPLDEAREDWLAALCENGFSSRRESVPVREACGRITASAVYARRCSPHYAASAMDGIALLASDTFGVTETTPVRLSPEHFTVVDTGDPIPEGCDAVVMVEDIVRGEDGSVTLHAAAAPWQHIRQIGEDVCAGEMMIGAGMRVTPAAIGALFAGGVIEIEAVAPPLVAIIPTGDEIVPADVEPGAGDIPEFNSAIFSAMLAERGARARVYPIVPDDPEKITAAVSRAADECDMVLLGAGSSAGREDYSAAVIAKLGTVLHHGIAIKPGKPAILGSIGAKPVLGVPGYPVSGIIVLEQLLFPLLDRWFARCEERNIYKQAVLSRAVVSGLKYREFVRVRMGCVGGRLIASPLERGAGVVSSFMKADGILEVPQDKEGFEAGERVNIRLLTPEDRLENTLVVIGSHDPLIDELADMLHRKHPQLYISSSHVGSMGGIMALRRGEAHMGGCHLLDAETGEYNTAYIKRFFPNGGVKRVRCVGRIQGLMLQKGNPLGIKEFGDIARPGVRYVNRQKGSGTRVLADHLLSRGGIDPAAVYGYDREELTHTAAAAQIACGSADAGLGIFSAARIYDLDFLPVFTEQYDLLIADSAWDSPLVRAALEVLRSEEFIARLEAMGGYTTDGIGETVE